MWKMVIIIVIAIGRSPSPVTSRERYIRAYHITHVFFFITTTMTTDIIPIRTFSYRLLSAESDLEVLLRFRKECGWGELKVRKGWVDPDFDFVIFTLVSPNGDVEDIGMAGWRLNLPDDPETANREKGAVHIGKSLPPRLNIIIILLF
jgi:hypothetical protein